MLQRSEINYHFCKKKIIDFIPVQVQFFYNHINSSYFECLRSKEYDQLSWIKTIFKDRLESRVKTQIASIKDMKFSALFSAVVYQNYIKLCQFRRMNFWGIRA